jgi:hypothetical protein
MRSLGLGRSISLFIHKLFISFTFEVFALSCTQSNERPHKSSKTKYSKLQFQGMFIQTLPALCDPAAHKQGWPTRSVSRSPTPAREILDQAWEMLVDSAGAQDLAACRPLAGPTHSYPLLA